MVTLEMPDNTAKRLLLALRQLLCAVAWPPQEVQEFKQALSLAVEGDSLKPGDRIRHTRTGRYGIVIPRPDGKEVSVEGDTLVWWMEDGNAGGSVRGRVHGSFTSALVRT